MRETFVYALSNGIYVAGAVALLGAFVALVMIGPRTAPQLDETHTQLDELAAGRAADPVHA
jgi:hypothetical protein